MTSLVDPDLTRTELLVELNRWNTQHPRHKINVSFSRRDDDEIVAQELLQSDLSRENNPIQRKAGLAKAYVDGMLRIQSGADFDNFPWPSAEARLKSLIMSIQEEVRGGRSLGSRSGGSSSSRPGSSRGRHGRIVIG